MSRSRVFLLSLGAGVLMAVFAFGGLLLGAWLDGAFGFTPCLSLLLSLVGVIVSAILAYRLLLWGMPRRS